MSASIALPCFGQAQIDDRGFFLSAWLLSIGSVAASGVLLLSLGSERLKQSCHQPCCSALQFPSCSLYLLGRSEMTLCLMFLHVVRMSKAALTKAGRMSAVLLLVVPTGFLAAQIKPNCDTGCGGSTGTSSGMIAARAAITASRGFGPKFSRGMPIDRGVVIPGNNSFTYAVPLFKLPGRGLNLNLALYYNSFIWTVTGTNAITLNSDRDTPSYGFRLDFGWLSFCCAGGSDALTGVLTEPNGLKHPIALSPSNQYVTSDSSNIQLQGTSGGGWVAIYKSGLRVTYALINPSGFELAYRPIQIEDTNGNIISIVYLNNSNMLLSSVYDTVGRIINFFYDSTGTMLSCVTTGSSCTAANATTYNFTWNTGYFLNFNFNRTVGTTLQNGVTVLNVLTGVTRPDGTSVAFSYGDWAVVNKVQELSATGNVRYSSSYNFPPASVAALRFNPTYTLQTVFDGVNTARWNFLSAIQSTNGLITSMAITDPAGTTRATTFSSNGDWEDGLPVSEVICSPGSQPACQTGTGTTVLRTVNKTWTSDSATGFNPRLATLTTILEDGLTQSESVFNTYDANGNLTDLLEYDFGSGAHGALLRESVGSYASLANNILDRPAGIQIKDRNGNVLFHKKFNYDETTPTSVGASLPGRDPNFSATARGNLTSTVVYANAAAGTGSITSTFAYDSLGNLITSQAGCCTFNQRNFSSVTQYAYPDSVVTGPSGNQLTTSFIYNMSTGTVANTTDPNGNITTFSYDVDNRPLKTKTPDGVSVSNLYDDSSALPGVTTSNSANSVVTTTTLNGLGKPLTEQALNGASLVSARSFTYDLNERLSQASNPYGNDTPVYTAYQYDALGRVISVVPPAQTTGAPQNPYATNYSLTTSTFTDPAGKQRKQYRDALGRLLRVDEPGLINGQAAAGSLTISGSEQSVATSNGNGATAGTASVTFGGTTDRSTVVLTHAATQARVTVTIGGANSTNVDTVTSCTGVPPRQTCTTHTFKSADAGNIQLTVNAGGNVFSTGNVPYGGSSSQVSLASGLYSQFPANSLVTVSNPNGTNSFTITAATAGSSGNNFTVSTSLSSSCPISDNWSCPGPGWTMTLSGPNLSPTTGSPQNFTGGTDNVNQTMYDTGTATLGITVNGTQYTKTSNYSQNSTPNSIATDFYNQITSDSTLNKLIIAGPPGNGAVLQLTTTATGASTAYPLAAGAVTTSQYFAVGSSSFTASASGSTFAQGQNGTLYDAGTIKATLTGFGETPVVESAIFGQGSSTASVAGTLAAAFHNDPYSPVDATVPPGSSTITFTARTQGADPNNYSISIGEQSNYVSSFPAPSFANASVQLAGGVAPTPSLDPSVVLTTNYSYDAMGNLLQVNQGQQTRAYQYDGLGRVTSSTIPETGYQAATASYTDFGAPSQIIDPRVAPGTSTHLSTTIGYDPLNRPQTISSSDGTPTVTYAYNPPGSANNTGGRLASVTNGVASEAYQYDIMGRPTVCQKTIAGQTYSIQYAYNADGTLSSITYPSGRTVNLGEDAIGRLTQIGTNGSNLLNIGSYNDAGEILTETFGNGVSGTYTYNNQLQLSTLKYAGAASVLNLAYNYGGAQDNGQIQSINDLLVSSRSTSYSYDELGRLQAAQTNDLVSSNTWAFKYSYDRYGNRLSEIPTGGTASMSMNEVLVDPTTNHITSGGYSYDAAGNMLSDGLYAYSYNALNQMTSVAPVGGSPATATFNYDANGLRVIKNSTVYIYSGRKVIAEYPSGAAAASPTTEHVYRGELRLASITGGVTTYHYSDHLSVRADTDSQGNVVHTYGQFPFGATWYETGAADKWKFTSYENDIESGLNYAGARFQSPRVGRFTALDPLSGHLRNPQSLNRYVYAKNDPVNLIDPTGLCGEDPENENGCYSQEQDQGPGSPGSGGDDTGTPSQCTGNCVFDISFVFYGIDAVPDFNFNPSFGSIDSITAAVSGPTLSYDSGSQSMSSDPEYDAMLSFVDRSVVGIAGVVNIFTGLGKLATGTVLAAVGPETGGLSSLLSAYYLVNGSGQTLAGIAQIGYGITGNVDAKHTAEGTIAATTISGAVTYSLTGNMHTAGFVGSIENFAPAGLLMLLEPENWHYAVEALSFSFEGESWSNGPPD
jgi:RHS repeat-associated protein